MSAMMSTIQNYLYPPDAQSKARKNFIHENMKRIKKLQLDSKAKAQQNQPPVPKKNNPRRKIHHRKGDGDCISEDLIISPSKKFDVPVTPDTEVQATQYDSQACQTLANAKDAYNEGIIVCSRGRLATPPPPEGRRNISTQIGEHHNKTSVQCAIEDLHQSNLPMTEDGKIDFVRLNAVIPIRKKTCPTKPDPTKAPSNYQKGVLPKYLKEAKKQHIEQVKAAGLVQVLSDPDCPDGHILLSEEEKKKNIKEMRKAYAGLVAELNSLPLKSDSVRIRKRRGEIESALQSIEQGIKMFSRDKLYVKITEN